MAADQLLAQKKQIIRQSWMTGFWKIRSKHRISLFGDFTSFTVYFQKRKSSAPIYWQRKTDNYLRLRPKERPCDHPNRWVVQGTSRSDTSRDLHLKPHRCIYLLYIYNPHHCFKGHCMARRQWCVWTVYDMCNVQMHHTTYCCNYVTWEFGN